MLGVMYGRCLIYINKMFIYVRGIIVKLFIKEIKCRDREKFDSLK